MGLGLFFLSLGARHIPAAEAALITQLENVLGPLWVWLADIERPPAATIAGGVIVICAVVFQVTQGRLVDDDADGGSYVTGVPSRGR